MKKIFYVKDSYIIQKKRDKLGLEHFPARSLDAYEQKPYTDST